MRVHHLLQATLKRGAIRKQFVGRDSKRILISCSGGLAFPLFRSHVGRRAANSSTHAGDTTIEFRYPKISQQELKIVRLLSPDTYEEVGEFDISMNNVTVMRMLQSVGGLLQKMIHMLWCQGFRSVVAQPARKRAIFA